ncbi:MAG: LppP/LprE family lipoprotein [Microthrixaceae bacterium]|nr:LppP/LprE family lipoprotein [Microthrixaceae bacterium]
MGPLTAVVVTCNAGGVGWPNELMFFEGEGEYYAHTDLLEGVDWESAGLNAPGRDGVTAITLQGDEPEVHTSALTIGDPECCPSGSAVLRLRVEGGGVRVTSVQGDQGD